jgi:glutaredoxin
MDSFVGLNAQVLGISVDHVPCLRAWAESLGEINFPLLSDFWPHGSVAKAYGVLRSDEGFSERALFVIDCDGIIRYIDIHNIDDRPDNEELRRVLIEIQPRVPLPMPSFEDEDEIPAGGIVLYCARWCQDCKKARTWLDARGLQYAEVDIDYHAAGRSRLRAWSGGPIITPTIDFDGAVVLDYDEAKYEEALKKLQS